MSNDLVLTIRCLVYNHEKYLRQCLDGFVMQQTNFKFEAIVHDDASTDNSQAIIKEYAEKYPDIIKPILQTENQYSKGVANIKHILNKHTHGHYFAICEGDDYWTDPHKLQKQVDFLEANPEYSMCFHNAELKFKNVTTTPFKQGQVEDRDYTNNELLKNWIIPTASVVAKREVLDFPLKGIDRIMYGDIIYFLTAAEIGKVRGMSEVMSVYRIQENSLIHSNGQGNHFTYANKLLKHLDFISDNFTIDKKFCLRQRGTAYILRAMSQKKLSVAFVRDLCKGLWLNPQILLEKFGFKQK